MPENLDELLSEIAERVQQMSDNLPPKIEVAAVSTSAKIPFKFICFREALLWRTEELARNALSLIKAQELLGGIVLTRCVSESAAAMWYIMEKINKEVDGVHDPNLDDIAMKMLLGDKSNSQVPDPVNVLTVIKHADKAIPGVEKQYAALCEYAHPNWTGTMLLYSKMDEDNYRTDFGRYPRGTKNSALIGLSSLNMTLAVFQHAYNRVSDLMPDFVEKCEAELK
ncbi:hypothetical protein ABFZ85_09430 [Hyphococcus formosus]|uniref:hypothetical protein n=1 Tax=Hyphococcus formosus TaxID=3143534 RepID=UPI00398AEA9B